MTKKRLLVITSVLILLISYLLVFLIKNLYGPQANDTFAKEQMNTLESTPMPYGIERLEASDFVGKLNADGQFIIWAGIAIKTDLAPQELETAIKALPEFEKAEIWPHELDLSSKLRFSGFQKDFYGSDFKGIYLIGVTFEPRTIFDKRNK